MTKQFKPLLSATLEPQDVHKLVWPVLASPKLDGIRAIVKDGVIVSRNLKAIQNKHVLALLSRPDLSGMDGELIVGLATDPKCFRNTSSGIMSEDGQPDFKFHVFDVVPEQFGYAVDTQFYNRFQLLSEKVLQIAKEVPELSGKVVRVEHEVIRNEKELAAYEQNMLERGYEGIMIRSFHGVYKYGRSTFKEQILLKLKRFKEDEATVIGFQERMHNANEATTNALGETERSSHKENLVGRGDLGALVIEYKGHKLTVGTGFDDATRKEIWDNQSKYMGRFITIKFFEYGEYEVPRFPVFKGFRSERDMDAA